ncbi:MAG: hypothetical protein PHS04_16565 [Tissierellia bacterium]|nr:hypothetical protein [Tissierellia bacterium]
MNNRFNSEKAAEADNYLRTYKNTKEIIVAKEEEISRLQYHIAKIPQDSSNFLQMQSELAECKRILEAQILVLRGELIKVGEVIDKIDNSRYRAVLELLYINGKRLYDLQKKLWLSYDRLKIVKKEALESAYDVIHKP